MSPSPGLAVRSAYSIGLHRHEVYEIFPEKERETRLKVWRSLFILDRFLAVSLGRPVAISEEECSIELLLPPPNDEPGEQQICTAGLLATVRSCLVMGSILRTVYQQRKISTSLAQELADKCREWPEHLDPRLYWRHASPDDVRKAVAILHSNLAYCHSIILLTRPFFLYLLSGEISRTRLHSDAFPSRARGKMERFSNVCIKASTHTVALVQTAYEGGYLPRLNPFPTYAIFTAALIIFANEYARPSASHLWAQCMQNSITILRYCGEMDPQAKRASYILLEFRNVIQAQANSNPFMLQGANLQWPSLPGGVSSAIPQPPSQQGYPPIPSLPGATGPPAYESLPSLTATILLSTSSPSQGGATTLAPPQTLDDEPFSGLLDLTNTVLPTSNDPEQSSADDGFEFDRLYQMPDMSPCQTPSGLSPDPIPPEITRGGRTVAGGKDSGGTAPSL